MHKEGVLFMKNKKSKLALLSSMALMGVLFTLGSTKKLNVSLSSSVDDEDEKAKVISQREISADELDFPNIGRLENQSIYEFLVNHNLPFCRIDGQYYTLNGNKILFYLAKDYASPIEIIITDKDGKDTNYLSAPDGYTLVGNQALKYVKRAAILPDDMSIHLQRPNEISVIDIVDSQPYSSLLKNDLSLTLRRK